MRTPALLALVVATLACGSDPAPAPPADAAPDIADPCAGVSCLAGTVCSRGACILAPSDAGPQDAPREAGADVAVEDAGDAMVDAGADADRDASAEAGRDAIVTPVDVDPGCDAGAPSRCGAACVDHNHDNNNCGTCGRVCAGTLSECVFGICQIPLDGG